MSRAVVRLLPYIGVVAAFAALRTNAIGGFVADVVTLEDPTFVGWAATLGGVAVHYLGILLAPAELQTDRYYKVAVGVRQAFDAQAWLGVGALVLLGAVAGWDIVRTRRVGGPARLAYGIGFAAVAMGPYAHIVPFGAVMAERFLHIGLFGFAWCLGVAGMALLHGRARLGPLLVSAVVLSWGFRSALRSSDWQSAVYVWEPVVRAIPNDGYAQFSLGHSLLSEGRIEEGRAHLERAVALNPTNGSGKNLLAITMLQQGEVDAAEALFQAATTAPDDRTHAFNGLGTVAERRGKLVTALGYFEQAMKLDPTQRLARDNVARTQERIARAEAIRAAIEPGPAESPERLRELDAACQALEDQPCRVAVAALLAEGSTSGADFH